MPFKVAIVDLRPDLLAFLKEKLEDQRFEVTTVFTEDEAARIEPKPDVMNPGVDLAEVLHAI